MEQENLLYLKRGAEAEALGKTDEARDIYVEAVYRLNGSFLALQRLLRLELSSQNTEAAEVVLDTEIEMFRENFVGIQQKAEFLISQGRSKEAVHLLEAEENRFGDHSLYWYFRGKALVSSGQAGAALELMKRQEDAAQSPADVVLLNKIKASAYRELGDYRNAGVLWKKIYSLTKDRDSLFQLAALCWREELEDAALSHISVLLENPVKDIVRYQAYCLYINILREKDPADAWQTAKKACSELAEPALKVQKKIFLPLLEEWNRQLSEMQAKPDFK